MSSEYLVWVAMGLGPLVAVSPCPHLRHRSRLPLVRTLSTGWCGSSVLSGISALTLSVYFVVSRPLIMQILAIIWPPKIKHPHRVWRFIGVVQLIDRLAFILIWICLCLSRNGVLVKTTLLGQGPWLDFGVYLAIALIRISLLALAILCPRSWLSKAWLELPFHCVAIGFDIGFIVRLARGIPSKPYLHANLISPPFDQVTLILFYLGLTCLSLDLCISIILSLMILTAGWYGMASRRTRGRWWRRSVWAVLAVTDEDSDWPRTHDSPMRAVQRGFAFRDACKDLMTRLRAYRRNPRVEPVWLTVVRRTTALAGLAAIFAFGAFNIFINPTQQFRHPLPRRSVPVPLPSEAGFPDLIWGIMWLKTLNFKDVPPGNYVKNPFRAYSDKVGDLMGRFHAAASVEGNNFPCQWGDWWKWDGYRVDLGIVWSCYGLRAYLGDPSPGFPVAYPAVRLSWVGTEDVDHPLKGHITSIPIWDTNLPWLESFGPYLEWSVPVGANMSLNVGKSVIHARQGSFLDAVGFTQKSLEVIGFPPVSATPASTELSSQTTIEIRTDFGAFYGHNVDAWEEYIEDTMIEGLAATGGLYTSFDLIFALIFGRSLISILFGGKPISPFGAIAIAAKKSLRRRLLRKYPGLAADDGCERGKAVCDFMCDFVVDIGPIQPAKSHQGEVNNTTPNSQAQLAQHDGDDGTTESNSPAPSEDEIKQESAEDPRQPCVIPALSYRRHANLPCFDGPAL